MARVRISDETLNCFGNWVKTDGIDLTQYRKNPILLYMHKRGLAIGTVEDIRVENGEVTGELKFDGVRDESRYSKEQFKLGTLKMVSPGFDILETSDDLKLRKPGQKMKTVTRCVLSEVSVVDIGGNDNNMVLCHEGKELKLAAGTECPAILLLNDNGQNEEYQMKLIALKLGLPETATEKEILDQLGILEGFKAEKETLKTELDTLKLAGITQMVDGAIAGGKFTADKKEHFLALGKAMGADSLKQTLDAMQSVTRPMQLVKPDGTVSAPAAAAAAADYKKLSEVPADKLMLMRKENPDEYKGLFKAEYGMDCPELED